MSDVENVKWFFNWFAGYTPRLVRSLVYGYLTFEIGSNMYTATAVEGQTTMQAIGEINPLIASVWTLMTEWYYKDSKDVPVLTKGA